jgi:protein arginine kinase
VNELFILTQPAHLQKIEGRFLSSAQRDVKRANLIRRRLEGR